MGRGAIVIGLAAVIIGEVIFGKVFHNFALKLLAAVFGAIIYYIVIQFVLRMGLSTDDLKLLTALVVALFLAVPYLEEQATFPAKPKSVKGGCRAMLEIDNIVKTFNAGTVNEKTRAERRDASLWTTETSVTVIGGNGAGKSTMLNAVAGVLPVDAGSIVIDGMDVTKLPEHKRAKYHRPRLSGSHDGHRRHHAD